MLSEDKTINECPENSESQQEEKDENLIELPETFIKYKFGKYEKIGELFIFCIARIDENEDKHISVLFIHIRDNKVLYNVEDMPPGYKVLKLIFEPITDISLLIKDSLESGSLLIELSDNTYMTTREQYNVLINIIFTGKMFTSLLGEIVTLYNSGIDVINKVKNDIELLDKKISSLVEKVNIN